MTILATEKITIKQKGGDHKVQREERHMIYAAKTEETSGMSPERTQEGGKSDKNPSQLYASHFVN